MARGKREGVSDELDALLEKMESVTSRGGGYWRPPKGRSVIRVLPAVGEMKYFFQEVGRHYSLPDGASEFCPDFTTGGEAKCPICELVAELYKGTESDRALASKLRVRKSYWMNVVVRDAKDKGGDTGSDPKIYTPGVTVFNTMIALVRNPEYAEFYDPDDGIDLTIDKQGEGLDTEYQVLPRRGDIPLSTDPDQADEWLETAEDLSWVALDDDPAHDKELSEDAVVILLPYNRMLEKYGIGPGSEVSSLQVEDESYQASTRSRRGSAAKEGGDELPEKEDEVGSAIRERRRRRRTK